MTTKFAALFRLTLLYSANTSRFLLLILADSSTERVLRLLVRSAFVFAGFAVGLVLRCEAANSSRQLIQSCWSSVRTFGALCFGDDVIWTWICEIERFSKFTTQAQGVCKVTCKACFKINSNRIAGYDGR